MAAICYQCGKKPTYGNKVSHSNNKRRRRWMPNLKKVRVKIRGIAKSVRLCTRCIRTGKLQKAAYSRLVTL